MSFKYKLSCYPENTEGNLQLCSSKECKHFKGIALKSGTFSTKLENPPFSSPEMYYFAVKSGNNLLLETSPFVYTSGSCDACQPFKIDP